MWERRLLRCDWNRLLLLTVDSERCYVCQPLIWSVIINHDRPTKDFISQTLAWADFHFRLGKLNLKNNIFNWKFKNTQLSTPTFQLSVFLSFCLSPLHWGGRLGIVWNMCFSTTTEAEWSKAVRSWQASSQLFPFHGSSVTFSLLQWFERLKTMNL